VLAYAAGKSDSPPADRHIVQVAVNRPSGLDQRSKNPITGERDRGASLGVEGDASQTFARTLRSYFLRGL
jgi:hypothetical protein